MEFMENGKLILHESEVDVEEDGPLTELRRGPWTAEEDLALVNYISVHGDGRWNSLARHAGLKRTGKSCRLRWLNYLRPDVRRGNISPEEQLVILELHSRWGNRWSKIAQHLPGRTDNEIKNYWRTRVQKHAKQLQCDVNSKQFKDVMRYLWMPRLIERIQAGEGSGGSYYRPPIAGESPAPFAGGGESSSCSLAASTSSDSLGTNPPPPAPPPAMEVADGGEGVQGGGGGFTAGDENQGGALVGSFWLDSMMSPSGYGNQMVEYEQSSWWFGEAAAGMDVDLWNVEDDNLFSLMQKY